MCRKAKIAPIPPPRTTITKPQPTVAKPSLPAPCITAYHVRVPIPAATPEASVATSAVLCRMERSRDPSETISRAIAAAEKPAVQSPYSSNGSLAPDNSNTPHTRTHGPNDPTKAAAAAAIATTPNSASPVLADVAGASLCCRTDTSHAPVLVPGRDDPWNGGQAYPPVRGLPRAPSVAIAQSWTPAPSCPPFAATIRAPRSHHS